MENQVCRNKLRSDPKLDVYRKSLNILTRSRVPYLVGGAYALCHYTGIFRDTKDLDIFIRTEDCSRMLDAFAEAGFETEVTFSHWLAKATWNGHLVDIIFSSGNALSQVDDEWFRNAREGNMFGIPVRYIPPEEMLWSKGFVMERERYDGADVNHVLLACAKDLDWERLLDRYGPYWRVLLSHLVLFGFVYPSRRDSIPEWVMSRLTTLLKDNAGPAPQDRICLGTLLSREQYKIDIERGFQDPRLPPHGNMTAEQIRDWDAGSPSNPCDLPD